MGLNLPAEVRSQFQAVPGLYELGVSYTPGTTPVTLIRVDDAANVTKAKGTTVPSAEANYAKGCEFIKTNTSNGSACTYINIGDATTCNFQLGAAVTPISYKNDAAATKGTNNRLYLGAVSGGPFTVGETVTQATSLATAVVAAVGTGYIDVNTVTGTFDATHVVTGGTSSATSTPTMALIDVWTPAFTPRTPIVGSKSTTQYTQVNKGTLLTTTKFRFQSALGQIESLTSDAISTFNLEYGS